MIKLYALAAALLVLSACGGDSSSNNADHPLTGTWFGTADLITTPASYDTFTIEIDPNGDVSAFAVGGTDLDITAELKIKSNGFYFYESSNGGEFILRLEGDNLVYVSPDDEVAMLEQTDSRPSYELTDAVGSYEGTEFVFDSNYHLVAAHDGQGEVTGSSDPLTLETGSAASGCSMEGLLSLGSSVSGVYTGTFNNASGSGCLDNGYLKAYLSPDRDAVLLVACESFSTSVVPEKCAFSVGEKQ